MTPNPLAVAADRLGVPYEGSKLAWALFLAIAEFFNADTADPDADEKLYRIVQHLWTGEGPVPNAE